jgi:hypothetical protein
VSEKYDIAKQKIAQLSDLAGTKESALASDLELLSAKYNKVSTFRIAIWS